MGRWLLLLAFGAVVFAWSVTAVAAPPLPRPDPVALLNPTSLDALSGNLRGFLMQNLPSPLFEAKHDWGKTKNVARGLVWRGQGIHVYPEVQRSPKNHGTWRKVQVKADNLPDTLIVDLRNLQFPEAGRMTFEGFLSFDTQIDFEQQEWERGRKLYAGSARARLRLKLKLQCEATTQLQTKGGLLPDAVFRLRVTKADLTYDNFVLEHVAGVGGELSRLIGDALQGGLRRWHPSLEKNLLARADAAIVKAGDTKEVRLGLSTLFARQGRKKSD